MTEQGWNHERAEVNVVDVHYARHGASVPLVLPHGWPEFWYVYRKNKPALAEGFDVVAPDSRGFGDSGKPAPPDSPRDLLKEMVEDLRGLVYAFGFERFGIVGHDVGAYAAQGFARRGTRTTRSRHTTRTAGSSSPPTT